jgi:uncharacterized protein YecT (DUF1311 family)
MIRLLVCLVLLASPAVAQDADVDLLANCLDRFEGDVNGARIACGGLVARPCLSTEAGTTTTGMVACSAREELAWQSLRDEVLARLTEAAMSDDSRSHLQGAESAWTAWRDAECPARAHAHAAGAMRQLSAAACRLDLMRERVLQLWYR